MGCPLKDRCFWLKVNQDEWAKKSCEKDYHSCVYFKICRDSKNVEECTKAIYRYQHEVEGYFWVYFKNLHRGD